MRVLVTGAGGFIGQALLPVLTAQHHEIVRAGPTAAIRFDWSDLTGSRFAVHGALKSIDCVIHLAGLAEAPASGDARTQLVQANVDATRWLAQMSLDAGVRRFVFVSSSKVLGDESGSPLTEEALFAPIGEYAASKVEAELMLRDVLTDTPTQLAIVRPPLVYGPGVSSSFATLMRAGASGLPLPFGGATARRHFIAVVNLARFLALLVDKGEGIFHVTDAEPWSAAELLNHVGALADKPARLFGAPRSLVEGLASLVGRRAVVSRLFMPLLLADTRARLELGWQPQPMDWQAQYLQETIRWYLQNR